MLQFFRQMWQRLWGRLRYCGAVHYLAGGPSLPPPLTPEQEKTLLDRMAAGDAAAREELITHNLRLVVYLAKKYENSGVPAALCCGQRRVPGLLAAFCAPDAPAGAWTLLLGDDVAEDVGV